MWGGGGGNDLSYLNHIIIAHYNASYGCGKYLKQAFVSSSTLHNHKKVCIGLIPKKSTRGSGSKPSSSGGAMAAIGVLPRLPPRRTARLTLQTPRGPVPLLPHRLHHRRMRALPGRAPATRHARTVVATRMTSAHSATVLPMSLNSCILSIKNFVAKLMCLL